MSRLNKRLSFARNAFAWTVLAGSVLPGAVRAQLAPSPAPSPLAPGDLKRPIFDTQTPDYNKADQEAKSAATVVAEVDGRVVTLGDVKDAIATLPPSTKNLPFAELFPGVLAKLVQVQALVIRAQRQGIDEDPAIRRKIKAASDNVLADAGLERDGSRAVTEDALLQRYNQDIAGKPGPEEAHVRLIMVRTETEAKDIIKELKAGGDFATIARRSSVDTTASVGGDVGFVVRNVLTPEIGAVVFSMEPGQITP